MTRTDIVPVRSLPGWIAGPMPCAQSGQLRTVIKVGGKEELQLARQERDRFMKKLRRRRRAAEAAAYGRAYRAKNAERIRQLKRAWREANRLHVAAYMRRYDALNPGRREYKARKAREYRAARKVAQ
jgi:hypothetical protein